MSDFTLPLGTLLTKREAGLMGYSIMGGLFAHTTVNLPDGSVLMLFREERVQQWGMERITELRRIQVQGGCVSCGTPVRSAPTAETSAPTLVTGECRGASCKGE